MAEKQKQSLSIDEFEKMPDSISVDDFEKDGGHVSQDQDDEELTSIPVGPLRIPAKKGQVKSALIGAAETIPVVRTYLPEIAAGVERGAKAITGQEVPSQDEAERYYQDRIAKLKDKYGTAGMAGKVASIGGQFAGAMAMAPVEVAGAVSQIPRWKQLLQASAAAGGIGATVGGLSKPEVGETRIGNAVTQGLTSAVIPGATEAALSGYSALRNEAVPALYKSAKKAAIRVLDPTRAKYKQLADSGMEDEVATYILNDLKWSDNATSLNKVAVQKQSELGDKISDEYKAADLATGGKLLNRTAQAKVLSKELPAEGGTEEAESGLDYVKRHLFGKYFRGGERVDNPAMLGMDAGSKGGYSSGSPAESEPLREILYGTRGKYKYRQSVEGEPNIYYGPVGKEVGTETAEYDIPMEYGRDSLTGAKKNRVMGPYDPVPKDEIQRKGRATYTKYKYDPPEEPAGTYPNAPGDYVGQENYKYYGPISGQDQFTGAPVIKKSDPYSAPSGSSAGMTPGSPDQRDVVMSAEQAWNNLKARDEQTNFSKFGSDEGWKDYFLKLIRPKDREMLNQAVVGARGGESQLPELNKEFSINKVISELSDNSVLSEELAGSSLESAMNAYAMAKAAQGNPNLLISKQAAGMVQRHGNTYKALAAKKTAEFLENNPGKFGKYSQMLLAAKNDPQKFNSLIWMLSDKPDFKEMLDLDVDRSQEPVKSKQERQQDFLNQ